MGSLESVRILLNFQLKLPLGICFYVFLFCVSYVDSINVVELAAVEFSRQHVNVIHLLHQMVENIALARELSIGRATYTTARLVSKHRLLNLYA